jgi:hypothetical protein
MISGKWKLLSSIRYSDVLIIGSKLIFFRSLSRSLISLFKPVVSHPVGMRSEVDVFHFIGIESALLFMIGLGIGQ